MRGMTLEYITEYIDEKIKLNEKKVVFTFFELKCQRNQTEDEKKYFLSMAKIRLENLGYYVYTTGDYYTEDKQLKRVEINEELIAIKKEVDSDDKRRQNIKTKYTKIKHTRQSNRKIRK